jgi:DNA polymerase-3 subunit alpha
VEDHAGSLECVLFADVFEAARSCLEADRVVLVRGRLDRREGEGMAKIVATEVLDFETKRGDLDHTLYVRVALAGREEKFLVQLGDVLSRYPGRGDVVLSLETGTGRRVRMRAQRFRVGVHPDLLAELRGMLGADAVRLGEATNGRKGR